MSNTPMIDSAACRLTIATSLAPVEPMLEFGRTEHPIRQAILRSPMSISAALFAYPTVRDWA
jgi:hypothetical protein